MAKLKCPACKTPLLEPLPERCPTCQLEGLNRMFLTFEDYEDWKKNVLNEHIEKLRNHRVSVGEDGVLVLLGDGRLFGFGHNTQGQYGSNHIGKRIDKPEKIADNVISATAGYNYSLYLDAQGKVHFLGNSGIPYKERFDQGNLVFKEVYARNDKDVFWAVDKDDKIYTWGAVGNHRRKLLKIFAPIEFKLYEITNLSWDTDESIIAVWLKRSGEIVCLRKMELSIKTGSDYAEFIKEYGECNLEVDFPMIKNDESEQIPTFYSTDELDSFLESQFIFTNDGYKNTVLIRPVVYLNNRCVFRPTHIEEKNILDYEYQSSTYDDLTCHWLPKKLHETFKNIDLKKSVHIKGHLYGKGRAVLENNGTLYTCMYHENLYERRYIKLASMNNVVDIDSCDFWGRCYFIDSAKRLWHIDRAKFSRLYLYPVNDYRREPGDEKFFELVYEF